MKKCMIILCAVFVCFSCGCGLVRDPVIASLGNYRAKALYTEGAVQDFTDYGKYTFDEAHPENSSYFELLTEEQMQTLCRYLDDFEGRVASLRESDPACELASHYDFRRDLLSPDDYWYLSVDPDYPDYGNYTLYLFDAETLTVYYFHNNV